ncbi:MAG: ComF family protein [Erythrobacter sp.]|uniref:ComF family protein n=1 Tax=Erythrobacter sp. TaxID=1042 RepID=UPI0032637874
MHIAKGIKEGLRPLVDLVYPPRCASCGAATANQGSLCLDCWGELEFPVSKAKPKDARHGGIIAATVYNDMSRGLLLKFKHGGKLALAPLLGKMMASRIHVDVGANPLIVPVPLHRTRIWQRGFNQSAMLAREIAKAGKGELIVDALVRQKRTPSLGNMSADKRKTVLAGAIVIRLKARGLIKGREIILVDDVLTSGATSDACVEALLGAGASKVRIACFARADHGALG